MDVVVVVVCMGRQIKVFAAFYRASETCRTNSNDFPYKIISIFASASEISGELVKLMEKLEFCGLFSFFLSTGIFFPFALFAIVREGARYSTKTSPDYRSDTGDDG